MAFVIGRLAERITRVPFGVNVLWDPHGDGDSGGGHGRAVSCARFFRALYASDMGLWSPDGSRGPMRRAVAGSGAAIF